MISIINVVNFGYPKKREKRADQESPKWPLHSGLGTKSESKQKREEAFSLEKSANHETQGLKTLG